MKVVYGDVGPCNNNALYTDNTLGLIFNCGPGQTRTWTDGDGNKLVVHCDESGDGGFTATWFDHYGHQLNEEHLDKDHCPFDSITVRSILWGCFPGQTNGWRNDLDRSTLTVHCEAGGKTQVVWLDPADHASGTENFDGRNCPVNADILGTIIMHTDYAPSFVNFPCGSPYTQTTYDSGYQPTETVYFEQDGSKKVFFYGKDGKTITKIEKFGADKCLTESDAFVYDNSGQLKEQIISDQYYNCQFPLRVTHKTPQNTTAVWLYDDHGGVVSVTTFDEHGVPRRSVTLGPSWPSAPPAGSGGTAGVVGPGASGGTAGVVGPGATPSGGQNKTNLSHPGSSITGQKSASGATAGVAGPGTDTATGGNKRKIIWQKSSSAATDTLTGRNSATGGTMGVAGPGTGTATGSTAGVVGPGASGGQNKTNLTGTTGSPTAAPTATPSLKHLSKALGTPGVTGPRHEPIPTPTPKLHKEAPSRILGKSMTGPTPTPKKGKPTPTPTPLIR